MKKVLVTVAALGLVFGLAANALALDQPARASVTEQDTAPKVAQPTAPGVALWSVTGQWVLAGAYLSDGLGGPGGAALHGDSPGADPFYIYSFKMNPTLQVNDKIAMKGEFRFADRTVFGLTDTAQANPVPTATRDVGGRIIDTYLLYMEWESPYGKTRFGRTPAGGWGSKFLDNAAQGNRLMIWLNMLPENWGSLIFTQKITEQDAGEDLVFPAMASDMDKDGYYVDLSYKADFGKTTGALFFVRDAAASATADKVPYTSSNLWLHGNYNFAPITLEWELNWGFGEASATTDQDNQLGLYADMGYKMNDWTFGGIFAYASGDNDTDPDSSAMLSASTGLGRDFNPTQILTGDYMNILNGDNPLTGDHVYSSIVDSNQDGTADYNAGAWLLEAYAKYAMSPAMTLNGYIAYAAATDEPSGWDDSYGIEAGIGMGYKLMDNLTYYAHFSYLWTGDFFKEGPYNESTNDIYLAAHALTMSF